LQSKKTVIEGCLGWSQLCGNCLLKHIIEGKDISKGRKSMNTSAGTGQPEGVEDTGN
jgi:hypothetical protein